LIFKDIVKITKTKPEFKVPIILSKLNPLILKRVLKAKILI